MKVTVKLFATFREGRFDLKEIDFSGKPTVRDISNLLNLNESDIAIIFINGRHGTLDEKINDHDTIAFFPPIGGG